MTTTGYVEVNLDKIGKRRVFSFRGRFIFLDSDFDCGFHRWPPKFQFVGRSIAPTLMMTANERTATPNPFFSITLSAAAVAAQADCLTFSLDPPEVN